MRALRFRRNLTALRKRVSRSLRCQTALPGRYDRALLIGAIRHETRTLLDGALGNLELVSMASLWRSTPCCGLRSMRCSARRRRNLPTA